MSGAGKRHEQPAAKTVRTIATTGILTALTVIATMFTKIPTPIPQGYFNLGDSVILVAAVMFGAGVGGTVGAVGSALADVFLGGFLYAPITFLVKGAEGLIVGKLARSEYSFGAGRKPGVSAGGNRTEKLRAGAIPVMAVGAAVMVSGYFLAEAFILSTIDPSFGLIAAVTELPVNLIQGAVCIVIANFVVDSLKKRTSDQ